MGNLVGAFGLSHAPGMTGNPDAIVPEKSASIVDGWRRLREKFEQARPDVLIGVSNDHFQNFFKVQPAFCVGIADTHILPRKAYEKSLRLASHPVEGHRSFGQSLLEVARESGVDLAYSEELYFQDEFSVPKHFLDPDDRVPLLPILTNCLNRNQPSPKRFYELGRVIYETIKGRPEEERIAIMGTGGLAHDPAGPNWCLIDEEFDRRFLELLVRGETDELLEEFTLEKIFGPGKGGTPEILNWFAPLGVVGAGSRATSYCYEPVPEWATGIGLLAWDVHL